MIKQFKKISVVVITSILPVKCLPNKVDENDVILLTERKVVSGYLNINFEYFFSVPASNFILRLVSKRWAAYYNVAKHTRIEAKYGRWVYPVAVIRVPRVGSYINYLAFLLSIPFFKKRLRELICKFNPNIVHAHNLQSNGLLARYIRKIYGIPYVITARIDKQQRFSKNELDILKGASAIIGLTPSHKKKIPVEFREKFVMIPHGVDDTFFIKRTRIPDLPLRIISIARLLEYKNIQNVVTALSSVQENFEYHIYGRGPEFEPLQDLISSLSLTGKVFLHGYVDYEMVPEILRNMDIFVLPSFPETFGRVYIEAMAAGVPIVACKKSGMDGVIEDKREGFLLDDPSVENIRRVMLEVLENPEILREMGENAIVKARNFHWDQIATNLYEVYAKHSRP